MEKTNDKCLETKFSKENVNSIDSYKVDVQFQKRQFVF